MPEPSPPALRLGGRGQRSSLSAPAGHRYLLLLGVRLAVRFGSPLFVVRPRLRSSSGPSSRKQVATKRAGRQAWRKALGKVCELMLAEDVPISVAFVPSGQGSIRRRKAGCRARVGGHGRAACGVAGWRSERAHPDGMARWNDAPAVGADRRGEPDPGQAGGGATAKGSEGSRRLPTAHPGGAERCAVGATGGKSGCHGRLAGEAVGRVAGDRPASIHDARCDLPSGLAADQWTLDATTGSQARLAVGGRQDINSHLQQHLTGKTMRTFAVITIIIITHRGAIERSSSRH